MGAPDAAVKEKKGGFGAIKGFFKKVGGGDGKHWTAASLASSFLLHLFLLS
jgi:hypothetical protein